jgi:hypothetical protein
VKTGESHARLSGGVPNAGSWEKRVAFEKISEETGRKDSADKKGRDAV